MKGDKKRKKLFDLYSQNLKNWLEQRGYKLFYTNETGERIIISEPILFCPLCFIGFHEISLYDKQSIDHLTIEHIPPESVGGKEKILTCKICNGTAGKNLDHNIQRELSLEPFLKLLPGSSVEGTVRINDGYPLTTRLTYENGGFTVAPQRTKHSKDYYDNVMDALKLGGVGTTFKFTFKGGIRRKANLSLLRSAYLEMFYYFGHDFIIGNPNAEKIREQIRHPDKQLLPHDSLLLNEFDEKHIGISLITHPKDMRCFVVVLPIKMKGGTYKKNVGVVIPGPDEQGWNNYINIENNSGVHMKLFKFEWKNCIRKKERTFAFNEFWDNI